MRPHIIHNKAKGLIYYPVRKAASSSIQHALGTTVLTLREARATPGTHFTVVRNPLQRLASLYVGSVKPAATGFYHPWARHGIYCDMPFKNYIKTICGLRQDSTIDEHFHIADWPRFVPNLRVYYFDELEKLQDELQLALPRIGPSFASRQPVYTDSLEQLVINTYSYEYRTYDYWIRELARQKPYAP